MSKRSRITALLIVALCAAAGPGFAVVLPGSGAGADLADVPCTPTPSVALSPHSHPGHHRHPAPGTCAHTRQVTSAAPHPTQTEAPASAPAWPATSVPVSPRGLSSMPASPTTPTLGTGNSSSQPPRTSVPGAEAVSDQPGFFEVAAAPTGGSSRALIAVMLVLTLAAAGIVFVASQRGRRQGDSAASLVGTGEDSAATDIVPWDPGRPTDQPDRPRPRPAHPPRHRPGAHRGQMSQASARHRAEASRN
jgi:hypothetical protein